MLSYQDPSQMANLPTIEELQAYQKEAAQNSQFEDVSASVSIEIPSSSLQQPKSLVLEYLHAKMLAKETEEHLSSLKTQIIATYDPTNVAHSELYNGSLGLLRVQIKKEYSFRQNAEYTQAEQEIKALELTLKQKKASMKALQDAQIASNEAILVKQSPYLYCELPK